MSPNGRIGDPEGGANQGHARDREHVSELRALIAELQPRIVAARANSADPEGRLPRLHEGLASPMEMLFELRIRYRGGRYLWIATAKTLGDAMGAHVGGLGLPSVRRGGVRYFSIDAARKIDAGDAEALAADAASGDGMVGGGQPIGSGREKGDTAQDAVNDGAKPERSPEVPAADGALGDGAVVPS